MQQPIVASACRSESPVRLIYIFAYMLARVGVDVWSRRTQSSNTNDATCGVTW